MRGVTRGAAVLLLLAPSAAVGAEPARSIRLPAAPVLPQPMPPAPNPAAVVRLAGDSLYVIDAKVDCVVRAHPAGLVKVQKKKGPRDISAKFVDGTGLVEDRTYDGPFVFVVTAAGTGRVELDVIPIGLKSEADIASAVIDVDAGEGPRPPPKPEPNPDEPPKPVEPPAPIPGDGLRVLVVYESADGAAITAGQYAAMYGKASRELLNEKCAVGPDGKTREWRIYDKDVDAARDSKLWADALKRPRGKLPWLVVSNGKTGFEGPLVDDKQLAELVKKYGG